MASTRERTDLKVRTERAVLAAVRLPDSVFDPADPFGELAALAEQAGAVVVGELSQSLQAVCGQVYAQSLQSAMLIMALLYAACSLFFLLTWRRLAKDRVDGN